MTMESKNLLVAIINHNDNQNGISLKKAFAPHAKTLLIDSGSDFEEGEREEFDIRLPNVYYNGLLNEAYSYLHGELTHLLLITSDVEIPDAKALIDRITEVYSSRKVGVYAPSAAHSTHGHMNNKGTGKLRKVTFTEGFCFVMPKEYLDQICPINLEVNRIGHGIDVFMGYLSMKNKAYALVDDTIIVDHPHGSGYSDKEARVQRDNWFAQHEKKAQIFHIWATTDILKNKFGFYLIRLRLGL